VLSGAGNDGTLGITNSSLNVTAGASMLVNYYGGSTI